MWEFADDDPIAQILNGEEQSLLREAFVAFEGVEVTGFLSDVMVYPELAFGVVFAHDRIRNGSWIHTSGITQAWRIGKFMAIQTRNSLYAIASWHEDYPWPCLDEAGLVRPGLEGFPGSILR